MSAEKGASPMGVVFKGAMDADNGHGLTTASLAVEASAAFATFLFTKEAIPSPTEKAKC